MTLLVVIDWHTMSSYLQEVKNLPWYSTDTEKIRRLDEVRRMKRKEEKTRRLTVSPLPKPLFERQFTDCGDSRYLERHLEAPDVLKGLLMNRRMSIDELTTDNRRMSIDELTTDNLRMTVDELTTEREALIERVREYLANMARERTSSEGDTDLLARKRFPH